jgi:hypothetical protein
MLFIIAVCRPSDKGKTEPWPGRRNEALSAKAPRRHIVLLSCYWPKATNAGGLGAEPPRRTAAWHSPHEGSFWIFFGAQGSPVTHAWNGSFYFAPASSLPFIRRVRHKSRRLFRAVTHPDLGRSPQVRGPRRPGPIPTSSGPEQRQYRTRFIRRPSHWKDLTDFISRLVGRDAQPRRDSGHGRKRSPRPATGAARELDEAAAAQSGLRV